MQGITLNDIINQSKFTDNKREIVLSAIRRIDSDFQPIYTSPQLMYNNCLLDSLNRNIQPVEKTDFPVLYSRIDLKFLYLFHFSSQESGSEILNEKRNFTLDEYQRMFNGQLEVELKGVVKVKSIEKFREGDANVLLYVSSKKKSCPSIN